MSRIKVFICVCEEDYGLANVIKENFENVLNFEVFLAPKCLTFSEDYISDIWHNLTTSHILIPIISSSLNSSPFCNQEIGVALGKKIKIMPITFDGSRPKGLIEKMQVHEYSDFNDDSIRDFVGQVYSYILNNSKFSKIVDIAIDNLLIALNKSPSWKITTEIIYLIIKSHSIKKFAKEQIALIKKAALSNKYVYGPPYMFSELCSFMNDNYKMELTIKK